MPITCRECEQEFAKLITSTHLKKHRITTAEYRDKYGPDSLASPEYRAERSIANSGQNNPNYGKVWTQKQKSALGAKKQGIEPWNKGIKLEDTTAYREAARKRETRYQRGEIQRGKVSWSQEDRERISQQVREYAQNNPDKIQQRAVRAANTTKKQGHPRGFQGHSHSPEAREKIRNAALQANQKRTQRARNRTLARISESNLRLVGDYGWNLRLSCNNCNTEFSLTSQYFHDCRYHDKICPTCYPRDVTRSRGEQELYEFVKSIASDAVPNNRSVLQGRGEIDIWVPSRKIAIEFNGLYWHSQSALEAAGYSATRDRDKLEALIQAETKPIIVYEDEWNQNREVVQGRLRYALGDPLVESIGARKTKVIELPSREAREFCKQHHLQGAARSNYRLGLEDQHKKLLAVMTFSKSNPSRRIQGWEINRFCSLPGVRIPGGASKLFKHFIQVVQPESVISYGDRRWGSGELYRELGFVFDGNTQPGYWYFLPNQGIRIHRYQLRKNEHDDPNKTEYENRLAQGYLRIWDCGHTRWVWGHKNAR